MCGIVGYIGNKKAQNIIINGLKRLEYRGYDSAGFSTIENSQILTTKTKGKISNLSDILVANKIHNNSIGIGHTRWATHGEPNTKNAHPHNDYTNTFSVVHNGIIENHYSIKKFLKSKGVKFLSDTDSEVLAQLIGYIYKEQKLDFFNTVKSALKEVVGAYGIVVIKKDENKLIAARHGSPLIVGLGKNEKFVASDPSAILEFTRNILYLDDGEIVELTKDNHTIKHTDHDNEIIKQTKEIEYSLEQIEKGNYKHFMLKEIFEQPISIMESIRGRIDKDNKVNLGGIYDWTHEIISKKYIYLTACGTSWHAAQIGSYILESILRKPVKVEYASEFRYRNKHIDSDSLLIAISQSGETADTLAAIKKAKEYGALTLGVVNVVGSSIARETDCGVYMHAGPEIGVASTKAFTSQVVTLSLLGNFIGQHLGIKESKNILSDIKKLPNIIKNLLKLSDKILDISKSYVKSENFLYLGRGYQFPVALEGALKLKEISYIHAEGYPAAEMKHGPIALIDDKMPVVVIVTKKGYDKILSNIQEVKSRGGKLIIISTIDSEDLRKLATDFLYLEGATDLHNSLTPILTSIPLQLLSYHIATLKGCDVDQPRNLAKSVTVE